MRPNQQNYCYQDNRQPTFTIQFLLAATFSIAVLMALFQSDSGARTSYGVFSPYAPSLLLAIYLWKYAILRMRVARNVKQLAFGLLVAVSLPFIYWKCFIVPRDVVSSSGHMFGSPIWILMVPLISFVFLDCRRIWVSRDSYFSRSLVEIFAIFPLWSCVWLLINLKIDWVENYWYIGC